MEINKIYQGDCMELLKSIPDDSIDCVITDPPYNIHDLEWDKELDWNTLFNEFWRILKPKGNIIMFGAEPMCSQIRISQKRYRYDLIWKKSKCGSPLTAEYMPMKKHENIMVFGEPASKYNPQFTKGEPYKRKWTPNKVNNMGYGIEGVEEENEGTRHPISILDFPQNWRRQDQLHPTQKPIELLRWLIQTYTNEGDIILDPFLGSGTTIIGCKQLNRRWVGSEVNTDYVALINKRLKQKNLHHFSDTQGVLTDTRLIAIKRETSEVSLNPPTADFS